MLATTRTVIVDEIHAVAANKRGTHLALSLERLEALCGPGLQRIGLSATQKPIETVARFLVGQEPTRDLTIIDKGYQRERELIIEVPDSPLEAVMSARCGSRSMTGSPARRGAPDDAHLRQHAPPGRAGDPPAFRTASGGPGDGAPRQPQQGAAARPRSRG